MELGLGLVPLALDILAVILSWAGMGSPWAKKCGLSLCIRFKLFGSHNESELEATEAFAVIAMLLFVAAVVFGVLNLFTSILSKNLTFLGAAGASLAAAVCSIVAVIIFAARYVSDLNLDLDAGAILYIICLLLGLAAGVLWFVVKRKDASSAPE